MLFFVFFLAAFLIQGLSGSFQTEFGNWPDAAGHVINSLLIRDYMDGHIGENPVRYAERYYVHYPKVSIGMWPPLYYVVAASWMRVFGVSRVTLLTLAAVSVALLALLVAWFVRKMHGLGWGFAAGLTTLFLPQIMVGYTLFLLEVPVAAMQLAALLALIRYFEGGRLRQAALFGVLASAAMLTKGNAMALFLLPPLLVAVTGSWWVFRKPGIYLAGLIVLVIAMPWQLYSLKIHNDTALVDPIGLPFAISRVINLAEYIRIIWAGVGPAIFLVSLVGIISVIERLRKTYFALSSQPRASARDYSEALSAAGILSLWISSLVFHAIAPIPNQDGRYMTTVYACTVPLFAEGIWRLATLRADWSSRRLNARAVAIGGATMAIFLVFTFMFVPLSPMGFEYVNRLIQQSEHDSRGGLIFVCSDANGEGAAIVETAFSDRRRPGRYVLRASKYLSDNTWSPSQHNPVLASHGEILKMLHDYGVEFAIVDLNYSLWREDREALLSALQSDPQHWTVFYDGVPNGADRQLTVYRQNLDGIKSRIPVRVDTRHSIGKYLVEEVPK
jgi:Dolichyl-phosphate-mannose-protein mannosyltransferase